MLELAERKRSKLLEENEALDDSEKSEEVTDTSQEKENKASLEDILFNSDQEGKGSNSDLEGSNADIKKEKEKLKSVCL